MHRHPAIAEQPANRAQRGRLFNAKWFNTTYSHAIPRKPSR